jgi:hypothetical protein
MDSDVKTISINYDQDFRDLIEQDKPINNMNFVSINSYDQIRDVLGNKILQSTANIVHIQHEFNIFRSNQYYIELLKRLKRYSKKIILMTLHSVFTDHGRIRFYQKCSKLCDCLIVHQENAKQFLVDIGIFPHKIAVIPHGTPKIHNINYARRFFKSHKIKIIFSGFITETKSYEKALLNLISFPGFEIIVAGMAKDKEVIKRLLALKYKSQANLRIIPRFLEEKEQQSMINEADYLILPYDQNYYSASGMLHLGVGLNTITLVSSSPKFTELIERVPECEVVDGDYKQTILNIEKQKMQEEILDMLVEFAEETSWVRVAKMTSNLYDYLIRRSTYGLISKV